MARRKKEEAQDQGIVVLYTALMILLLAFFIMLNSLSKVEEEKVKQVVQSLQGSFSFQPGGMSPFGTTSRERSTSITSPINPADQDYNALRGLVSDQSLTDQVKLLRSAATRSVVIPAHLLFAPGSDQLQPQGQDFLFQVARVIGPREYPISLYGHTDDVPLDGGDTISLWDLSARRALSAVRFLVAQGVAPARLAAFGMAGHSPMYPNNSAKNRLRNNRVEMVFDLRDASQYLLPEDSQKPKLEFRGFFFDLLGKGSDKEKER